MRVSLIRANDANRANVFQSLQFGFTHLHSFGCTAQSTGPRPSKSTPCGTHLWYALLVGQAFYLSVTERPFQQPYHHPCRSDSSSFRFRVWPNTSIRATAPGIARSKVIDPRGNEVMRTTSLAEDAVY